MSDPNQGAPGAPQPIPPAAARDTGELRLDDLDAGPTGEHAALTDETQGERDDAAATGDGAEKGAPAAHGKPDADSLAPAHHEKPAEASHAPPAHTTPAARPDYVLQGQTITLWDSDGIRAALEAPITEKLLRAVDPDGVKLHTGPGGHLRPWSHQDPRPTLVVAIERVREILPHVEIHVGIGIDSIARDVLNHRVLPEKAGDRLIEIAGIASDHGAVSIEYDAEAEWKHPESGPRDRYLRTACGFIAKIRALYPHLFQGLTSYDHVLYHPEDRNPNRTDDQGVFPWSAFCGEGGVDYVTFQVYAGDGDDDPKTFTSTKGAMARMKRHEEQVRVASSRGWIRAELAPGGRGCLTYVQAHSVSTAGSVYLALHRGYASWWAVPARLDARGVAALQMAAALQRYAAEREIDPAEAVEHWQLENESRYGGEIDGLAGDKMFAAMGLTRVTL